MRTSIKTIIATGLLTLAISISSVYAVNVPALKSISTYGADISSIKKIIVSGNVYVNLVQASKSKILYENKNNANVVIKRVNNSLIIEGGDASLAGEITVYVNDIYRIDASGNAMVSTKDPFTLKNLQIFVKENAKVDVNAKTESLYTVIHDGAELKLQGHTKNHILTMDNLSKITLANFSAIKTDKNNSEIAYATVKF
ncbi:GIN domain-containing protein [Pedobacter insulae]|uniref:Putative auto-transporter adhesin head GIN domain-containing protein n=1 Tax=Pedobacter insulae TaxID=414048 RepID=A0A1I2UH54_9SPHI|nr:DUF2807 domain-containing protein [Pedobacter insulae]SFG75709.1 hypothetical protein SAMN04489864_102127 [Pedobacter insulae]